jgi:hypothetical protein
VAESQILEKQCAADNSTTFVQNLWELLAYRHPMPQRHPNSAHKPYRLSFTGFKTTLRNVQRSGILYRLLMK